MLTEQDFTLKKVDKQDGHEDFWFKTSDIADKELCMKYGEQGCEHVFEVVYSRDEDVIGIKRTFLWNWDVVLSEDEKLREILKKLSKENLGENRIC